MKANSRLPFQTRVTVVVDLSQNKTLQNHLKKKKIIDRNKPLWKIKLKLTNTTCIKCSSQPLESSILLEWTLASRQASRLWLKVVLHPGARNTQEKQYAKNVLENKAMQDVIFANKISALLVGAASTTKELAVSISKGSLKSLRFYRQISGRGTPVTLSITVSTKRVLIGEPIQTQRIKDSHKESCQRMTKIKANSYQDYQSAFRQENYKNSLSAPIHCNN